MSQPTIKDLTKEQLEYFLDQTGSGSYVFPVKTKIEPIDFSKSFYSTFEMYDRVVLSLNIQTQKLVKEELFNRKIEEVLNES